MSTHFTDETGARGAMKYTRCHRQGVVGVAGSPGLPAPKTAPPHGRPVPERPRAAVFRGMTGGSLGVLLRLHGLSAPVQAWDNDSALPDLIEDGCS